MTRSFVAQKESAKNTNTRHISNAILAFPVKTSSHHHTEATANLYRCRVFTCTVLDATVLEIDATFPTKSSSIWQAQAKGLSDTTFRSRSIKSWYRSSAITWYFGWNLKRVSFKVLYAYVAATLNSDNKSFRESIRQSRSAVSSHSEARYKVLKNRFEAFKHWWIDSMYFTCLWSECWSKISPKRHSKK